MKSGWINVVVYGETINMVVKLMIVMENYLWNIITAREQDMAWTTITIRRQNDKTKTNFKFSDSLDYSPRTKW